MDIRCVARFAAVDTDDETMVGLCVFRPLAAVAARVSELRTLLRTGRCTFVVSAAPSHVAFVVEPAQPGTLLTPIIAMLDESANAAESCWVPVLDPAAIRALDALRADGDLRGLHHNEVHVTVDRACFTAVHRWSGTIVETPEIDAVLAGVSAVARQTRRTQARRAVA